MKLENQVCSLKQAIKLKDLGISQQSLIYLSDTRKSWKEYNLTNGIFVPFSDMDISNGEYEKHFELWEAESSTKAYNDSTPVSLFTVGELGIMIADYVNEIWHEEGLWFFSEIKSGTTTSTVFTSEAMARGALLIKLIDEKILFVQNINQILTTPS